MEGVLEDIFEVFWKGYWKGTWRGTFEELGGELRWENWGATLAFWAFWDPHQKANLGRHIVVLPFCGGLYMRPIVSSIRDFSI